MAPQTSLVTLLMVKQAAGRLVSRSLACRMSLARTALVTELRLRLMDPRVGLSLSLGGPARRLAAGGDYDATGT